MQPVKAYLDSYGQLHRTVEEWQEAELMQMIHPMLDRVCETMKTKSLADACDGRLMAKEMLAQSDALVAILTTGPRSRPSARKKAGTTNPKRAVKRATPAQAEAGFARMRHAANGGSVDPSLAAGTDTPAESAEAVTAGAD